MYASTSLLVISLSRLLPFLFRKTKWGARSRYHRAALDHLKKNQLDDAVCLNCQSLAQDPNYEKAMVLADVLSMSIDAEIHDAEAERDRLAHRHSSLLTYQSQVISSPQSLHAPQFSALIRLVPPLVLILGTGVLAVFFHTLAHQSLAIGILVGFAVASGVLLAIGSEAETKKRKRWRRLGARLYRNWARLREQAEQVESRLQGSEERLSRLRELGRLVEEKKSDGVDVSRMGSWQHHIRRALDSVCHAAALRPKGSRA